MIHGFGTSADAATLNYEEITGRLRAAADQAGLRAVPIGVYWNADPGIGRSWVPKLIGSRLTSLLGLRKAVRNPYLEKVRLAERTGETGMRALLFRLQDEFPGVPVHAFAHSLGAQVLVSALAPAGAAPDVVQPAREARLGLAAIAGADVDCDIFSREHSAARAALPRAAVWWVTIPDKGKADAMLELRRGAGRGDAVGNRGLELRDEDRDRLLARRALVLDEGDIPVHHAFVDYFHDRRVRSLAWSLLYLQQPDARAAQESELAQLDRVLAGQTTPASAAPSASVRLYAAWRETHAGGKAGSVVSTAIDN
jgi:hypothetical protein